MSMSRRSFLKSSAAAATLTALGTTPSKDATAATKASRVAAASNPGDVVVSYPIIDLAELPYECLFFGPM